MTDYISREAVLREIRECFNNNGWYGNSRVELLNAIAALPGRDESDELAKLRKQNADLRRELIEQEKEFRREAREIAAEEAWKLRQGEDYGSY